ncbi:MAG: methyltransferase domain-containing protein [Desulfarculus sp.]|nr:methyltransferase domain-containing protein [Desulfarculus sp.]
MDIGQAFNHASREYDRLRRKFIPCFDDFYGVALSLLPRAKACGDERPIPMLELGAGTGLFSAMVLEAIPCARLTLVDLAPQMLEQARQRLAGQEARLTILEADYLRSELGGPYQAVFSALSIHHLEDQDKRTLFVKINALLAPGGVFVNADQVLGSSQAVQDFHHSLWMRQVLQAGITPAQMAQARERMTFDRLATLEDQLAWLRQAGFIDVDSHYRHYGFAAYAGRKPGGGA